MTIHLNKPDLTELKPKIAVIGVGGAGGNAVNNMIAADLQGVSFVVANTDAQALIHSKAETKIQLGAAMTEGLGAGSKPEIGAAAAEESIEEIRSHLRGLHMVFITAGMGGGTGTGAAPVIAAAARAEGVLTVGVVTKPFHFEGQRRMKSAEFGIELLSEQVDTLIVIPNQNLFRVAVMNTTFSEAFAMADQVLHDGISCITDVMVKEGIINLDFADVNLVMQGAGKAMMGTGEASGENRGREAAEAAISNPLLDDVSLHGAKGLLVSIIGGRDDLTLYEVDEAANRVREEVAPDANIIVGTAFDESLNGAVRVSVVATGLAENTGAAVQPANAPRKADRTLANRLEQLQPDQNMVAREKIMRGETLGEALLSPATRQPHKALPGQLTEGQRQDEATKASCPQDSLHENPLLDQEEKAFATTSATVRMPSYEDFPPVAQALLNEHSGQGQKTETAVGLETHKQRAGFFSRLAAMATGGKGVESNGVNEAIRGQTGDCVRETVVSRSQSATHLKGEADLSEAAFMDPHKKGGALSSSVSVQSGGKGVSVEHVEFPSFLKK